jgi:hypothetical protein
VWGGKKKVEAFEKKQRNTLEKDANTGTWYMDDRGTMLPEFKSNSRLGDSGVSGLRPEG